MNANKYGKILFEKELSLARKKMPTENLLRIMHGGRGDRHALRKGRVVDRSVAHQSAILGLVERVKVRVGIDNCEAANLGERNGHRSARDLLEEKRITNSHDKTWESESKCLGIAKGCTHTKSNLKAARPNIDDGAIADSLTCKELVRYVGVEQVRGELRDRVG